MAAAIPTFIPTAAGYPPDLTDQPRGDSCSVAFRPYVRRCCRRSPRRGPSGDGNSMRYSPLGPFADVSRLTLGGGGIGQGWGASSDEEAVATVHAALTAGITMIDTAPMYGACEAVVAKAFQ